MTLKTLVGAIIDAPLKPTSKEEYHVASRGLVP
jgi:hypothetical protein